MVLLNLKPAVVVPIDPYWFNILAHYYDDLRSPSTDGTTVWDWLSRDYNAHHPDAPLDPRTRILVFENDDDAVLFKLRFA
jgi:hypothetical protein